MLKPKTFFQTISDINERGEFEVLISGLTWAADQLKHESENMDSEEKQCAINNICSIVEAMRYISLVNNEVLKVQLEGDNQ